MTPKRVIKALGGTVVGVSTLFILSCAALVANGFRDDIHQADVAVVLGNSVLPNGQPSPRLKARLDKTVQLYKRGLFSNIVVSGGIEPEGFDEAIVMKQYLIAHGLPSPHIFMDRDGRTTYLTARNLATLAKANHWNSVFVISQYFHIPRTRLALEKFGVAPIYSAHADFFELRDLYSIPRELVGLGSYFLRDYHSSF
jgi:vancomycin permeability regulator SanA